MVGHLSTRAPEQWWDSCESSATHCFLPAVKKLPKDLRNLGHALLGCNARGENDPADRDELREFQMQQAQELERLDGERRRRLFTSLLRSMAQPVDLAWQWMQQLPLPAAMCEAPFRVPMAATPEAAPPSQTEQWSLAYRWHWLTRIIGLAAPFEGNTLSPAWLATWSPQLQRSLDEPIGFLLATVIDAGGPEGDEVFDILTRTAASNAASATAGHAVRALLSASREQGWNLVAQLLAMHQQSDPLRQSILAAMRYAHPDALCRMFEAIAEHQLVHHLAVVQMLDQWLGLAWATPGSKEAHDTVLELLALLRYQGEVVDLLRVSGGSPDQRARRAYLALWRIACRDAGESAVHAAALLNSPEVETRYAAVWHLARLPLPQAHAARCQGLDDVDLRVALCSLYGALPEGRPGPAYATDAAMFEPLERLVLRMPTSPIALKPLVWPWTSCVARRDAVARELMAALGSRSARHLIPHLESFDGRDRRVVVERLAEQPQIDEETRWTLLRLAADSEPDVAQAALLALARTGITPEDAVKLEGIAKWLPEELQPMVTELLLRLTDEQAIASAIRLLHARNRDQRYLGLCLLRQLAQADRRRGECIAVTRTWLAGRRRHQPREQEAIDAILASVKAPVTLDTALGLMRVASRSKGEPPTQRPVQLATPAVQQLLESLDSLVHEHRQERIACDDWGHGVQWVPLGEIAWRFPVPDFARPAAPQLARLPLQSLWETWHASNHGSWGEAPQLELLRAAIYLKLIEPAVLDSFRSWSKGSPQRQELIRQLLPEADRLVLKHGQVVQTVIEWLLMIHPPAGGLEFLVDGLETVAARLWQIAPLDAPADSDRLGPEQADWRELELVSVWAAALEDLTDLPLLPPGNEVIGRYWRLLRWLDEPAAGVPRMRPSLLWLSRAYLAGQANLHDVADHLLGPRPENSAPWESNFGSLAQVTAPEPAPELANFLDRPEIADLVDRCTERLLEIELAGDGTPAVHQAAASVLAFRGVKHLRQLLTALGESGFAAHGEGEVDLPSRLLPLVARTYPAPGETPQQCGEALRQAVAEGEFAAQRLLELPFVAPQWLEAAAAAIGWTGLADAIYWMLAHRRYIWGLELPTPPYHSDEEMVDLLRTNVAAGLAAPPQLSCCERAIRARTSIAAADRAEGAVDVAWFHRVIQTLTPEQWHALLAAAHQGASPAQVQRAMFIFDVLGGHISKQALIEGVEKRHIQENVRLLGLLPLSSEGPAQDELAARYRVMQHYRTHLEHLDPGARREAAEALAIGLRNLAATACFPDALMLRLAQEASLVADWLDSGARVLYDDLTLGLFVDPDGHPRFDIRQSGQLIKTVPRPLKSVPEVVTMRARAMRLRRDTSGLAASLEAAMCRGDSFTVQQLQQWAAHATLGPRLARSVLIGESCRGYPVAGGTALHDCTGREWPLEPEMPLRIAHPTDFVTTGDLAHWQRECQQAERKQPFKQLFREWYVPTDDEQATHGISPRYAGRRLRIAAALAALARCDWLLDEHGRPYKAFPADGVSVTINLGPAHGEQVELETLTFHAPCGAAIACEAVPLRVFSEVMREVELVWAAAHVGDLPSQATPLSKVHMLAPGGRHEGPALRRWHTAKNN